MGFPRVGSNPTVDNIFLPFLFASHTASMFAFALEHTPRRYMPVSMNALCISGSVSCAQALTGKKQCIQSQSKILLNIFRERIEKKCDVLTLTALNWLHVRWSCAR